MRKIFHKIAHETSAHWEHGLTTLHIGYFGFVVEHSHGPLVIIAGALAVLGVIALVTGKEF